MLSGEGENQQLSILLNALEKTSATAIEKLGLEDKRGLE